MLTICWAAKGGSGTTVTAAGLALAHSIPTLFVDLAGDVPEVLGLPPGSTPGVGDWLVADAPTDRLTGLEVPIGSHTSLLPWGTPDRAPVASRWAALATHLARDPRAVVVDAGTRPPVGPLAASAQTRLLVVRNCYLNVSAARRAIAATPPTGVIVVEEPGRRLGIADVEESLRAPVVAVVLVDPAIGRAADSGLLLGRIPAGLRRPLAALAATPATLGAAA